MLVFGQTRCTTVGMAQDSDMVRLLPILTLDKPKGKMINLFIRNTIPYTRKGGRAGWGKVH